MSDTDYHDRRARRAADDATLDTALADAGMDIDITGPWRIVTALLRGGWPGAWTRDQQLATIALLDDLQPEAVAATVRQLARDGVRFRPSASEIRARLAPDAAVPELDRADAPLPTGTAAISLVMRAGSATGYDPVSAADGLDQHHPALGAWARMRGLRDIWHLPIDDPDAGRWIRRDLVREWEAHARAWSDARHRQTLIRAALHAGRTAGQRRQLSRLSAQQLIGGAEQ
jgi:hypothetical protein